MKGSQLKERRELYRPAQELKQLAPWQWVGDVDLLGVQDPRTGGNAHASVPGKLGEVVGLVAYLGRDGLYSHPDLLASEWEEPAGALGSGCVRDHSWGDGLEPYATRFAFVLEDSPLDWPEEGWARCPELVALLAALLAGSGVEPVYVGELPALEGARGSPMDRIQRGGPPPPGG